MTQPEREDDTTFATMSQKLDMTICWLQCLMGTRRIVGYHVWRKNVALLVTVFEWEDVQSWVKISEWKIVQLWVTCVNGKNV